MKYDLIFVSATLDIRIRFCKILDSRERIEKIKRREMPGFFQVKVIDSVFDNSYTGTKIYIGNDDKVFFEDERAQLFDFIFRGEWIHDEN